MGEKNINELPFRKSGLINLPPNYKGSIKPMHLVFGFICTTFETRSFRDEKYPETTFKPNSLDWRGPK
jgi:hypothetical protein